mmetsp:Transcript_27066/g.64240  ORF Transcript_27066/g.64240 Transcript_27066/m.64240 type:complete len:157 (-) Transcript_27066:65-535(-)
MTYATYAISCHCGAIHARFRRDETDETLVAWDCNCSDCAMRRNVHFMVRGEDLWLVLNADDRSESTTPEARRSYEENTILYQWGTKTAVRRFCKTCGVLPFYVPRSNPDGFGVTLACVDWGDDGAPAVEVRNYDGVNWEKSHAETGIAEQTAAKRH